MKRETFHHFADGRGRRQIFVNGNRISRVIWADEEKGVLCFHPYPLRRHRRDPFSIYSRKLRGKITVLFEKEDLKA
ncbi:hypothetical protein LUG75_000131 [Escherichia coli]|uniref:hypothetical protein n=1 Tax=Enterobacteriaceae TaxID=543 RepID=UPI00132FFC56|nr:hypothetical protein [Citrobacter werkmanii]EIQ0040727.1 hypothetical protein [Escherichia coli]